MAAGDSGNARPCLGREMPGNDLPESKCATSVRNGDTEAISVAPLTPPQLLEVFLISSGL